MDNSAFFTQETFATGNESTLHNISPSHQSAINLDHSSSETSIHRTSGSAHHTSAEVNNNNNSIGNSNERGSPLHLASMLHSLSLGGAIHQNVPQAQQQQQQSTVSKPDMLQGSYLLILKKLPQDITLRECYAIFALANGVVNIDLIKERKNSASSLTDDCEVSAIARFGSLQLVTHYASILSSKSDIFGPTSSCSPYIELIDEVANQQVHFERPKYGVSQSNYQLASATVPVTPVSAVHQQQQQQQQSSPIASTSTRPSLMQTRSRFSFNDPFSSDQKAQHMSEQQQKLQTKPGSVITHSRSNQDSSSTDVGKSFLLLENDDINDSIWGSNAMPSSMNGFSSTPQPSTPILEWGSNNRKPSSSFFLSQSGGATGTQPPVPQTVDVSSSLHGMPGRTSNSASIATPFNLLGQIPTNGQPNIPSAMSGSDMSGQRKHNMFINTKQQQQDQQKQQPHTHQQQQQHQQSMQEQTVSSSQTGTPQKSSQMRGSVSRVAHSANGTQKGSISNPSSSTNVAGSGAISQADLSLLARVPPPANPADQNPPCNTLYVGNLPPDTTEQELRHLFSGQQGFRRLSFRNKNSNGNGHGPMCFVEFEDVSFATRALAELYGSQLPRASASNKGGIRLSFSKNPLGVRGPNNRRNGSSTSVNTPTSSNSGNNSGFGNYSYPAGFNKV